VLYLVAAQVIETVVAELEEFVTERVLRPVGMDSTTVFTLRRATLPATSPPLTPRRRQTRPILPFLSENTNPAGGITGATDMAKDDRAARFRGSGEGSGAPTPEFGHS
jgi:CubicO group peptidase (beta-lactamase class C family)